MTRIGVDLGGTKIEAVVLDLADDDAAASDGDADAPRELARARVPTDRALGYDHIVATTRSLIEAVAKDAGVNVASTPIGIGMPGSVTMRRADGSASAVPLIKNANTTCLNGQPFRRDLENAVGRSIVFANDANCFTLAETMWGAARGSRVSFGVIMGTGVGGGLVLRSSASSASSASSPSVRLRAWDGAQGIAGEWGHVVLDPSATDRPCYCGKYGCIETFLSGPAIEAAYARRVGGGGGGASRKLVDIAARSASNEDPVAREIIAECIDIFGRALATVINIVDPDAIVLGGGVSNLDVLYDEGIRSVARWVFNDVLATKIVKNTLGDSAGVLGAALLP